MRSGYQKKKESERELKRKEGKRSKRKMGK
jgi:hypothetical protein